MSGKKPNLFVVGMVNFNWSLDWNAKTLSKHISKEKFNVMAMITYRDQTGIEGLDGVKLLKRNYPDKFWRFWVYLRALFWADLAIVYRHNEFLRYRWLFRLFKCPVITIMGINPNLKSEQFGAKYWRQFDAVYSLSPENKSFCENALIPVEEVILPNPIELEEFWKAREVKSELKELVFIGNRFDRKRLDEYLDMAEVFPNLTFNVVGGYDHELPGLNETLKQRKLKNVKSHGMISRKALIEVLKDCQLHILPSRIEGRPKTAIESAAAGIPSILFYGYGAEEYIKHGQNGFMVNDKSEMLVHIKELISSPDLLKRLSENTSDIAKAFDIRSRIIEYEDELERLLSSLG